MKLNRVALFGAFLLAGCSEPATQNEIADTPHPGQAVYENTCASCHDDVMPRTPHVDLLHRMTADSIYDAVTNGMMKENAADLSDNDRRAVADLALDQKAPGRGMVNAELPSSGSKTS